MSKLALLGGEAVRKSSYPEWPFYDREEQNALNTVLRSRHWGTLGPETAAFEKEFAEYLGTAGVLGIANGTASLETALRALDIRPGDEVILPPYTFIATLASVISAGALPVFADIDPKTLTLDPAAAAAAVTPRTKAVVPVHMGGIPADMDAISALRDVPGIEPITPGSGTTRNTLHLFMFRYDSAAFAGIPKNLFVQALNAEGIPSSSGYIPLYSQAMLKHASTLRSVPEIAEARYEPLPVTEKARREVCWLPQNLLQGNKEDIDDIILGMMKIYKHADDMAGGK